MVAILSEPQYAKCITIAMLSAKTLLSLLYVSFVLFDAGYNDFKIDIYI